MKKFNLTLFSLLVVFVLVSCSKEKKIERSLYKKGGEWNINSQKLEIYNDGELSLSNSYVNSGTISFSKNGTLVWTSSLNGQVTSTNGSWSNTEDKLTLTVDYQALEYDIKEYSKTKMSIESFNSVTYDGVVSTSSMIMVLEKK